MHNLLTDSFGREQSGDGDIELGNAKTDAAEASLEGFFRRINEIEKLIEKLAKVLQGLEDANEEYKSHTNAASMKAIRQGMAKDVDEAKQIAVLTKSKIEALDSDNLANLKKPGCGKGSGVERSRTATTLSIKKKFQQKLSEFQSLREKIQKDHRELVERRVFTVTGTNADEETIDLLIETGRSEQIFQKAIMEQGRGQVVDTVAEIQERHDMVKEIERKLLDLQQIFLDMSVLVNTQGDMLDNIETHVSTAVDHVESGTSSLRKARKLQKNTRKWTCIALIIVLIIALVIVLSVVKPWNKK